MLRETYISNYLIDLEMNKKCLRMAIMEKYQQRKLQMIKEINRQPSK